MLNNVVLLAILLAATTNLAQAKEGRFSVLALDHQKRFKLDPKMAEFFESNGIDIVVKPITEPLNQPMLKQFHLVLMSQFGGLQAPWFSQADQVRNFFVMKRNITEVRAYVESGGGLVFIPNLGEAGGGAATEAFEPLLGPWGVRVVAANARDPEHGWETYAWTTNITESPLTKDVKRLFYPTQMGRWDDLYPTPPIQLHDERWRPVVRGMPGSSTQLCLRYTEWFPTEPAQDPPILAAIAELGQGRAAVFSISPIYLLSHAYQEPKKKYVGEFSTGEVNGVVVEKGDGKQTSDGRRLLLNLMKWTGSSGVAGLGGYTEAAYNALPKPDPPAIPKWLQGWRSDSGAQLYKTLIGARSAYSDGDGTVAEYAEAARKAGYSILVMTETFEHFEAKDWARFRKDCEAATTEDLVVLAGLDLADEYGARYLLFGQSAFPQKFMLTDNGQALKQTPYLMLGLTPSTCALARPGGSPLPHEIYKFFSALAVYTYRDGKLVDNGIPAYEWHIHNRSLPLPFVVHEVYSPAGVEAATSGHQLFVPADTPANASWYLRNGHQHYWEVPARFLVTSGPVIRGLTSSSFSVQNDEPIKDVRYLVDYQLLRRWRPNATEFSGQVSLNHPQRTWGYMVVTDAKGRTAISPPLKGGKGHGYDWRCSDHQNWFGGAVNYTGTRLTGGVDLRVPTFGTNEGRGLWPHGGGPRRGENMAPLISFPFNSPAVTITDAKVDQRYRKALWEEVAGDAKASHGTAPSRVYEANVRYHDFHYEGFYDFTRRSTRPMMVVEVTVRLRKPVVPEDSVFPGIARVGHRPTRHVVDGDGKKWCHRQSSKAWSHFRVGLLPTA